MLSDRKYDYYAIIPHATEPHVLLLSTEHGLCLPHFRLSQRYSWQDVGHVNRAMCEQFGIEVTTLRPMSSEYDAVAEHVTRVYAMENHNPDWVPPARARWVSRDQLARETLAIPAQRQLLEDWFDWVTAEASENRLPWYQVGWFDRARNWVHTQLDDLGLTPTSNVKQLRSWCISSLFKVGTSQGDVYFKAVPPVFAQEPVATEALARLYPRNIPIVLASDSERGWLLMKGFAGTPLLSQPEIPLWSRALGFYAKLQIDFVTRAHRLIPLGCPDRRPAMLAAQVEPLHTDAQTMAPHSDGQLSHDELQQLGALVPRVKAMCDELEQCGIPNTLVHGDFHCGNVIVAEEDYIYIDWSDACLAHPFFDIAVFLHTDEFNPDAPDAKQQLRDAYLAPWAELYPQDKVAKAFELAMCLGALHQAISYRNIIKNLEPRCRREMGSALPHWLRKVLAAAI